MLSTGNALRAAAALLLAATAASAASCAGGTGRASDQATTRVALADAAALVRARIFEDTPTMNPSVATPIVDLTTAEMWERLGVQLVQVTEGVRACHTFLVLGGRAHSLCGGFGGHGIQSACVTDLDGDGAAELTYTHSWGSGIHRSLVGVARVVGEELVVEEAGVAYEGDLFVRRETDAFVIVEIGEYHFEFGSWTREAALGRLRVAPDGGSLRPLVELAPLSDEHAPFVRRQ